MTLLLQARIRCCDKPIGRGLAASVPQRTEGLAPFFLAPVPPSVLAQGQAPPQPAEPVP